MMLRWFVISLSFLFGCGVVGVSLVNAATVYPTQTTPTATPMVASEATAVLPGQILYPMHVATQKVQLFLMSDADRAHKQLDLAVERWNSAQELVSFQQLDEAVLTLLKGHQYVAQTVPYVQDSNDAVLKDETIATLKKFRAVVEKLKPAFSDQQKVILDQTLAENESLLLHLGSSIQ